MSYAKQAQEVGNGQGAAEATAWQARPLEPPYPVILFYGLRVTIREDAVGMNKAAYLTLGLLPGGARDVPGLWTEQTQGRSSG